jgi:hypothetical protein
MSEETFRVFLATPTYDNTRAEGSATAIRQCTRRYATAVWPHTSSLMDQNFNILLARALEERDAGRATHFAMIHADVETEYGSPWLDTLMDVMTAKGADLVAAIVPTKEGLGRTSTAIDHAEDEWGLERVLTMHEVMRLPDSFGAEVCPGRRLLVNNGLMLLDLRRDWFDDPSLRWHTENRIKVEKLPGGKTKRTVQCVPQDWFFSRTLQKLGGSVVATRRVPVLHHGRMAWGNNVAWGEWQFDQERAKGPLLMAEPEIKTMSPAELDRLLSPAPAPAG